MQGLFSFKWFQKIGNKIMSVAILAGLVPVLLLGGTIAFKVRNDLVKQAMLSQQATTAAILSGIDALLNSYERHLSLIAQDPEIQGMDPRLQTENLYWFLDLNPVFYSCFVYLTDGYINTIAFQNRYTGYNEKFIGNNLLKSYERQYGPVQKAFHKVIDTGQPAFSGSVVTTENQRMLFLLVPIFDFVDYKKITGVLSCAISLDGSEMNDVIKGYPLSSGEILALIDKEGNLIAARGAQLPEGFNKISADFPSIDGKETSPVELNIGNRPFLGILASVSTLNGYLLVAKPREEILGFLSKLLFDLVLVLAVALLVAAGFSFAIARTLARNINHLMEGIQFVSAGKINHRVVVEGSDELAQACSAFNDMVETLEKARLMDEIWAREWNRKNTD